MVMLKGSDRGTFHGTNLVSIIKAITESHAAHHIAGLGVDLGDVLSSMPGPMPIKLPTVAFTTTRRSTSRALERFSAVSIAVSQPFLSRSWDENGGKLCFLGCNEAIFAAPRLKTSPS
jgi:hypothetical protein